MHVKITVLEYLSMFGHCSFLRGHDMLFVEPHAETLRIKGIKGKGAVANKRPDKQLLPTGTYEDAPLTPLCVRVWLQE